MTASDTTTALADRRAMLREPRVAPSILSADFARLGAQVKEVLDPVGLAVPGKLGEQRPSLRENPPDKQRIAIGERPSRALGRVGSAP